MYVRTASNPMPDDMWATLTWHVTTKKGVQVEQAVQVEPYVDNIRGRRPLDKMKTCLR